MPFTPAAAKSPTRGFVQPPSQVGVVNHCMYGCGKPDPATGKVVKLDERGYCKHLVGFVIDDGVVELREAIPGHESYERCGVLTDAVRDTDEVLVMPNCSRQAVNTRRVYRKDGNA